MVQMEEGFKPCKGRFRVPAFLQGLSGPQRMEQGELVQQLRIVSLDAEPSVQPALGALQHRHPRWRERRRAGHLPEMGTGQGQVDVWAAGGETERLLQDLAGFPAVRFRARGLRRPGALSGSSRRVR